MNWRDLVLRARAAFLPGRAEQDLDDELALHLEMQARKNRDSGMSVSEAERAAKRQFGSLALVEEECRDARGIGLLETLRQDAAYALRGMRRSPGFALSVILTIGLGLGVNTAAFTVFNAYILRPLAVTDPYSLYEAHWLRESGRHDGFKWQQFQQLRTNSPVFTDALASRGMQLQVNGRQCFAELVTGNYFSMLGVGASMGRTLVPSDSEAAGREPVMVLSYSAWQNFFSSDPDIIGRRLLVHGYPLTVVGVARAGFGGLGDVTRDFWVPGSMYAQLAEGPDPFAANSHESLQVIGRLRRGVSERSARRMLNEMAPRLPLYPLNAPHPPTIDVRSNATAVYVTREALTLLMPLIVAFALILVMACANVANLMLARAVARQREIGIRLSLGAARSRLIRQLLTESVLLALPGALVGLAVSQVSLEGGVRAMFAVLPAEFADYIRVAPFDPDLRVFGFMMLAALLSGLLFGILPALQSTRTGFAHQYRPQRTRNFLVLTQITVCATLLIGAGILLRSANRIANRDWGIRTSDALTIELQEKFRERILDRLSSHPIVREIANSTVVPLDSGFPSARVAAGGGLIDASYDSVSPEFFDVLGIQIRRGRNFTADETSSGSAVAIVSEDFARHKWPGSDGIGQTISLIPDSRSHLSEAAPLRSRQLRVVGVAADFQTGLIDDQNSRMMIYIPTARTRAGNLLLRVYGDPEAARQRIVRELEESAPGSVDRIHRMQSLAEGRAFPFRMAYWVSATLGALALLLAVSGIYGVLSYLVAQRTREIGVRIALGATAASVTGLVVRQSLRLSAIGIALGALAGIAVWKLLASAMLALNSFELTPFAGGAALVLLACVAAAAIPAMRAARVDPLAALRHD